MGPEATTRQHKSTDAMRILGTGGVAIAGSTRTNTMTLNVAKDPAISQTMPSTQGFPQDTLRTTHSVRHRLDPQIHLSILKPLATPMVLSSQALGASCRLKRGNYSSPLRIIPNIEASSGARLQVAKVERTHLLSPILIWFILSNHLPHQTRASGRTITTNSGAITVTEATATGETGNDPETGDGIHSMDIYPTNRPEMLSMKTADRSKGSTSRVEHVTPGTIPILLQTSLLEMDSNTITTKADKVSTNTPTLTTITRKNRTTLQR